jgi:F-type H+-transporting ATPase subunit delta
MHERVRGYTDAVLEGVGTDIGEVAGQLQAFSALLASSEDLRGVLVSPNVPAPARRAIVEELLSGKASPVVVALLRFAVQDGAGADYQADVAGIAASAAAKRDGKVVLEDWQLGRRAASERLDGYATALLGALDERQLGQVEDDLFRFVQIVEGDEAGLQAVLSTNELNGATRRTIVLELLSGRTTGEVTRMAAYAARWGRPRDYSVHLRGLIERVAGEANRRVADVRAAVELSDDERARLAAALSRFTGYQVAVRVTPQPDLLGGFVASVGDTVVDASLRRRLEEAQGLLFAPSPLPGAQARRPDEH